MPTIDELNVKITTQTKNVGSGIDSLISKLKNLSTQVGSIDTKGLQKFASGLQMMSNGMQGLQNVKLPDYSRIAKGIERFATVDGSKLASVSNAMLPLAKSINTLSNAKFNNKDVMNLVSSLTKLGNSNLQSVQNVDFYNLATSISQLSNVLSNAPTVASNTISLVNALARLGMSGRYISQASTGLAPLGSTLLTLNNSLAQAPVVASETIELTSALGLLANAGANAGVTASNMGALTTSLRNFMDVMSKAPAINSSVVSMTKSLAQLASQGRSVSSASKNMANGFNSYSSSANRAGKATKSLAYQFGKFYANFWLLIRAFKGIGKMITYASSLTEVQNVVDVTFGEMSYKVEDFAKTSIEQFGMSELALKEYSSRFQAMGSAMGISSRQIADANSYLNANVGDYVQLSDSISDVSLNLTKLTADMASFYNMEQADVAKDLESIYTGMTRPLRQYGLDLTEASLKEFAMSQGLNSNIKEMTQAEKTMLRYQYVLAHTTAAQGDFAKTADKQNYYVLSVA